MNIPLLFSLSLLPLVLAPLVARASKRSRALYEAFDLFVVVTLVGVILIEILPHALSLGGGLAWFAAAAGFFVPALVDRELHLKRWGRLGFAWIAFCGLTLHAVVDGIALFGSAVELGSEHGVRENARILAGAVILHRFPIALALWWLACPVLGRRAALGLLGSIGLGTLLGLAVAGPVWDSLSLPGLAIMQAAIAGMLLHVVVEVRPRSVLPASPGWRRWAAAMGAGVGMLAVLGLLVFDVHAGEAGHVQALDVLLPLVGGLLLGLWALSGASRR